MSDDQVTIEVDGKELKARKGQMLMEVTDAEGVYVPRFCYHEKLSVAANCRMCLVEVEKAPKPMPACATPVMDGMKVFTNSPRALSAQKATMEFLLINHPLDCPVCDQGGECELQDLAMGFGSDVSRYTEGKRVVPDKNIGPLVSTDMTRCIHCTRCVRFGEEVAGIQELGATGRGEHMQIGTYIEKSVDHELSGNVIDLCPVGALNSKPFRMRGRSWEMLEHALVAPHDCAGSNLFGHTLRGKFMRVVPRDNESINETWIADRDRFSYEGIHAGQRLQKPMLKIDGEWVETNWDEALEVAAKRLKAVLAEHGAEQLGVLASASSTLEEFWLLKRLANALGVANIDHRLRQVDFRNDADAPVYPSLGCGISELEAMNSVFVVGSSLRKDVPIVAHRVRKAAMAGAQVSFLNPRQYEFLFPVHAERVAGYAELVNELAAVAKAVADKSGKKLPASIAGIADKAEVNDAARAIAASLVDGERTTIILGDLAEGHPAFADLEVLAAAIADMAGATSGVLSGGANSVGGWLAGAVPHRDAAGKPAERAGLNAAEMLDKGLKAYLLHGVEPELDAWNAAHAEKAVQAAETVVMLTSFISERMKEYADVLLPIGTLGESSGTFVNAEGLWQHFGGAAKALGEARPAWKVLRVMGNLLEVDGFDYMEPGDVTQECSDALVSIESAGTLSSSRKLEAFKADKGLHRVAETALYGTDMLVRRAASLQATDDTLRQRAVIMHSEDAAAAKVQSGDEVVLSANGDSTQAVVAIDDGLARGNVFLASGLEGVAGFGARFTPVSVSKA
ncbi:MAG: NADH-quinone oxidoreductase subunit NuoG [Gammaproteobacteria bacterium]|nr:NADH-quinone oxidoreductase subunit NuoG [Gammaproteobacteria bacterium]